MIADVVMAGFLSMGLLSSWTMVFDRRTVVPLLASLQKVVSSGGLGAVQWHLDLFATAAVSAAYTVAFVLLALLRRPSPRRVSP